MKIEISDDEWTEIMECVGDDCSEYLRCIRMNLKKESVMNDKSLSFSLGQYGKPIFIGFCSPYEEDDDDWEIFKLSLEYIPNAKVFSTPYMPEKIFGSIDEFFINKKRLVDLNNYIVPTFRLYGICDCDLDDHSISNNIIVRAISSEKRIIKENGQDRIHFNTFSREIERDIEFYDFLSVLSYLSEKINKNKQENI